MKKLLVVVALLPVVAATAIAGVVSSPSKVRPCFEEYTKGVNGSPTHMILGPGGDLYAAEEPEGKILRFNPETREAREYDVRITPHDLTDGPDGKIWFVSAPGNLGRKDSGADKLGSLDLETGEVTLYPGISRGSEPHMLRWNRDGRLYITEQKTGGFAIFDPRTGQIEEGTFGLPAGNSIHNIVLVPNGDFWAVLQEGDALARFNFEAQRFDKFVEIPIKDSGPRDITYVESRNAVFATLFAANKLAEYDLDTGKLTLHDVGVDSIAYAEAITRSPVPKLTFIRADAKEEALWVATLAGGELRRFDLDSGEVKRVGCGVTIPGGPLGLANDTKGRLWVAVPFPGRIAEVKL